MLLTDALLVTGKLREKDNVSPLNTCRLSRAKTLSTSAAELEAFRHRAADERAVNSLFWTNLSRNTHDQMTVSTGLGFPSLLYL